MESPADKRRSIILDELARNRVVKIADLSEKFDVSAVSLRRDLEYLDRLGLAKRIHGGAMAVPNVSPHEPNSLKPQSHSEEKERIGRVAAAMIDPGDHIIFDSGTTVFQVACSVSGELLASGNLSAITCSLPVVQALGPWKQVHLVVLGGIYLPEYQTLVGPHAIENLNGLHADKLFLGADGITFSNGVTTANILEAEVDRAMVRAASKVIVVSDSSKIGEIGLTTIIPLDEIDCLVTDDKVPLDFVEALRSQGIEVVLA
jgi:DeoR/GlpR family transcriptional regulator of sugar metabolism